MLACALSLRVFLPLLAAPSVGRIVVIDAGHGGFDGGAQGAHASEKDLNLAVAKSLKAALEERLNEMLPVTTQLLGSTGRGEIVESGFMI